jgi:proteic killer suppression protein
MHIEYKSRALQKACTSDREMQRAYGAIRAKFLRRRLNELENASTLEIMTKVPGVRCHGLRGDREGQWAVSLDGNWRLVFLPDHEPLPALPDGGLDTAAVTQILVLEVVDYH